MSCRVLYGVKYCIVLDYYIIYYTRIIYIWIYIYVCIHVHMYIQAWQVYTRSRLEVQKLGAGRYQIVSSPACVVVWSWGSSGFSWESWHVVGSWSFFFYSHKAWFGWVLLGLLLDSKCSRIWRRWHKGGCAPWFPGASQLRWNGIGTLATACGHSSWEAQQ